MKDPEPQLLKYINDTPELLSLFYDLNLLPEQLVKDSADWRRMLILSCWHQETKRKKMNNVVTCVYCGHEYPEGTPTAKHNLLTEHIKTCEQHPMREAEAKIEMLRKALSGLIGAETPEDLEAMETMLRIMPGIEKDKIDAINAIHALQSLQKEK